jgi:hypothetical protein
MTNHQRKGSVSNAHAGREFEEAARLYFSRHENLILEPSYPLELGVATEKKTHRFDFGCQNPPVIVECKSHNWTETGIVPSAKIAVLNVAMYFFQLAPSKFRKILFVLESRHERRQETLTEYYVRTNGHLVPPDVSIIEYNPNSKIGRYVKTAG